MRKQALTLLLPNSIAQSYVPIFGYVPAGNPNIYREVFEGKVNLHQLLIPDPHANLIIKVGDVSMMDYGVFEKDYVVVDTLMTPNLDDLVLAVIRNHNLLTTFEYAYIKGLKIKGVVSHIIHFKKDISYFESSSRNSFYGDSFKKWLTSGIDLNQLLIKRPKETMILLVKGDSMIEDNIDDGDLVIVEQGGEPEDREIIVARINDGYTLKRFGRGDAFHANLIPANEKYNPIKINYQSNFVYHGKIIAVIKPKRKLDLIK